MTVEQMVNEEGKLARVSFPSTAQQLLITSVVFLKPVFCSIALMKKPLQQRPFLSGTERVLECRTLSHCGQFSNNSLILKRPWVNPDIRIPATLISHTSSGLPERTFLKVPYRLQDFLWTPNLRPKCMNHDLYSGQRPLLVFWPGMLAPPCGKNGLPRPEKSKPCPTPPHKNWQNRRDAAGQSWLQITQIMPTHLGLEWGNEGKSFHLVFCTACDYLVCRKNL